MSYICLKNCSLKNVLELKKDTGPGFLGTLQPVEMCNFAMPLEIMSFQYLCTRDKTHFWWRQQLLQFILRCTLRFFTSVKLRCCEVSAHSLNTFFLCAGWFCTLRYTEINLLTNVSIRIAFLCVSFEKCIVSCLWCPELSQPGHCWPVVKRKKFLSSIGEWRMIQNKLDGYIICHL